MRRSQLHNAVFRPSVVALAVLGSLLAAALACGPAAQSAGGEPTSTSPPTPTLAPTPTPAPIATPTPMPTPTRAPTVTPTPTPIPLPLGPGTPAPPDLGQRPIPTVPPLCLTPEGGVPKNAEDNQRAREHAQKEGIDCIVGSIGRETPEGVIIVKDVAVQLPSDAYVLRQIDLVWCVAGEPCPETPYFVLQRGGSKVWVSQRSGTIFEEKIAPGEEGAFDFLKEALG